MRKINIISFYRLQIDNVSCRTLRIVLTYKTVNGPEVKHFYANNLFTKHFVSIFSYNLTCVYILLTFYK